MHYLFQICYDPAVPPQGPSRQPDHARLEAELRAEGAYAGGAGLVPPEFVAPAEGRSGRQGHRRPLR